MLDSTAGNRRMWGDRSSSHIVFLDREFELGVPPDIFADNRYCPFRDGMFDCIIYDPPQEWGYKRGWRFAIPKYHYYGLDISYGELMNCLARAPAEFCRLLKSGGRLCLKWNERRLSLWKILVFFKNFKEVYRKKHQSNKGKNGKTIDTYWITFQSSLSKR